MLLIKFLDILFPSHVKEVSGGFIRMKLYFAPVVPFAKVSAFLKWIVI